MTISANGYTIHHGQMIDCRINGFSVQGAIYILRSTRAWICHNIKSLDGDESPNRFGFKHSWVFNPQIIHDVKNLRPLFSEKIKYKETIIDCDFEYLLEQLISGEKFNIAFYRSLKPFDEYTRVLRSTKPGYIVLQGKFTNGEKKTTKSVEIKLSRYLKKMSDAYVESQNSVGETVNSVFTDSEIEQIYNKFVGYSSGEDFTLEFLSGDDINFGYTSKNYAKKIGTLGKSCMSDKIEFLDIYRNNKNCSLAVLKVADSIDARCLVWEINGVKYFDRIYYTVEWVGEAMRKKLTDAGCQSVIRLADGTEIILEKNQFNFYPYMDTFKYHLEGTNRFFNYLSDKQPKGIYRHYGTTVGGFTTERV